MTQPENRCQESGTGRTSNRQQLYIPFLQPASHEHSGMKRQRSVPHTFESRIAASRERLEAEASNLPDDPERESLRERIRQLEAAAAMNALLSADS